MWHAGILQRIDDLLKLISENPTTEDKIINSFKMGTFRGVSIKEIINVAKGASLIYLDELGILKCSGAGNILLCTPDPQSRMRFIVEALLKELSPSWVAASVQGRSALVKYAPPEFEQCLREAALMDTYDKNTIEWWDRLASKYRQDKSIVNLNIGRQGERLSMIYEQYRTGYVPNWTAIEFSGAGYDIISRVSKDDSTPLIIEVKTSTKPWDYAEFFITRFEWDTMCSKDFASIHLWSVKSIQPLVSIVNINDLRQHIAIDSGEGIWHACRCPFNVFKPFKFDK